MPVLAQDYGVGANLNVPLVEPGAINLNERWPADAGFGAWDDYGLNITEFLWEGPLDRSELDTWSEMRLRFAEDTLYVFINISRWDGHGYVFPENNPWEGDHILIGLDPTMEGDDAVDDSWGGWPMNAPEGGPYVYKISPTHGVTLNWGFDGAPDPMEEGWVRGIVEQFDDEWEGTVYRYFSARLAIYVPGITADSQIGFNVGGGFSTGDVVNNNNWYAWRPTADDYEEGRYPREPVAGHLQRYGDSYGTLSFVGPFVKDFYGSGVAAAVPYVAPGTITIDGEANEAAWNDALVLDVADFAWDGGYLDGYGAEADIDYEARVLYSDGVLYVNVHFQHYDELYWAPEGQPWGGNAILVGIDPIYEEGVSDQMVTGWNGFAHNNPNDGPIVFFIDGPRGITLNWGSGDEPVDPIEAGFADGVVWVDEATFSWGVELAIFSDAVTRGSQIGFNVGGVSGLEDVIYTEQGEGDYAWFSWTTCDSEWGFPVWCGPGGNMLQNTFGYSTLSLAGDVSIDEQPGTELPSAYRLDQNYPNPFNPSTTIEYGVPQSGHVSIAVYNPLGQRVATLIDGDRMAGSYTVRWDASDLPSGVYMYHLQVDGVTVSARKMMLIK
jgi:hypothetical protein